MPKIFRCKIPICLLVDPFEYVSLRIVFETHALPCGSGFNIAKQGIRKFNGRAHKSISPFFHTSSNAE